MKHLKTDKQATSAAERPDDHQLSAEQMAHIRTFVEQVGGIEKARQALLALDELQRAA